jgi:S1-C subfamily serine protease
MLSVIAAMALSASLPSEPPVTLIRCINGSGSGTWIDTNKVLTASHVADNINCLIDNKNVRVIYNDPKLDIAILETDATSETFLPVSCNGTKRGTVYRSFGWAFGSRFFLEPLKRTATDPKDKKGEYYGQLYNGMSGGPVLNEQGQIVAINIARIKVDLFRNPLAGRQLTAYARDLKQTSLCEGK